MPRITEPTSRQYPGEKLSVALDLWRQLDFRSHLELKNAVHIHLCGETFEYEDHRIKYVRPARSATYTPDMVLRNGIIIETKGLFETADRQKMKLVKAQHPDADIRFVFSDSSKTIGKRSSTTYGMWCTKEGFPYADELIPIEWMQEPWKELPASLT